jgi:hypothetical protein
MTDALLPWIRALVDDGATETWYLRAGTGAPVLVLAADPTLRESLMRALAGQARVTAPEPPPRAKVEFSAWLRGFLDGLGVVPAAIVADDTFAPPARDFALLEGDGAAPRVVAVDGAQDGSTAAERTTELLRRLTPR